MALLALPSLIKQEIVDNDELQHSSNASSFSANEHQAVKAVCIKKEPGREEEACTCDECLGLTFIKEDPIADTNIIQLPIKIENLGSDENVPTSNIFSSSANDNENQVVKAVCIKKEPGREEEACACDECFGLTFIKEDPIADTNIIQLPIKIENLGSDENSSSSVPSMKSEQLSPSLTQKRRTSSRAVVRVARSRFAAQLEQEKDSGQYQSHEDEYVPEDDSDVEISDFEEKNEKLPLVEIAKRSKSKRQILDSNDTRERPYQCKVCGGRYTQSIVLRIHMRTHTGERPYGPCEHCGARFSHPSSLKDHLLTHMGARPYKCSDCEAAFGQRAHLRLHRRRHTGEKPFSCPECDLKFADRSNMNKHIAHKHSGTGRQRIVGIVKKYACPYEGCEQRSASSSDLNKHVRVHTGERPYKCDKCPKAYKQSGELKSHKKKHH